MMLQIIGWLGCLYLIVKGCEALANSAYRSENGELNGYANTAVVLSFVGAVGFALWLLFQGGTFETKPPSYGSTDYMNTMNVDENLTTIDMNAMADTNAR